MLLICQTLGGEMYGEACSTCLNTPDENSCRVLTAAAMQIRCGDLYADKAVEAFTACAVSDKKCVPQRVDQSAFPEPPPCALDEKFDLNKFQVRRRRNP